MATLRVRRKRRQKPGVFRRHKQVWRDPYPHIKGTQPEKMIFAYLVLTRRFFVFQDTLEEWMDGQFSTLSVPEFIPDIVLPQWKVIIDPFSDFHHTLPEAVERDIRKMATYNSMGYAFYHPWATEVEEYGAAQIIAAIPELFTTPVYGLSARNLPFVQQGYRLGPYVGIGSSSVAAANRRRRRPPNLGLRVRR